MSANPPFDVAQAHRWFAVECNNAAWELVEAARRSPEEIERMLHLAHAAQVHWSAIGAPINQLRADQLLGFAYAVAGQSSRAIHFAERAVFLSEGNVEGQTPFDRASACAALSRAQRADGRIAEADSWRAKAREISREMPDDDRQVLERLLTGSVA
jgi:hypothetical protein